MSPENHNNIMIYLNNLSSYYVFCVVVSIICIAINFFYQFKKTSSETTKLNETVPQNISTIEDSTSDSDNNQDEPDDKVPILKNKTKEVIDKISAEMTQEQLQAEKETEQRQLSAILELLKKQEDKFQVSSMEELEGQLKLYRLKKNRERSSEFNCDWKSKKI